MDNRAIGVFDSGLGGLTAVKELHKILPNEHIVFLGDTARVPYGIHDKETICRYAHDDIHFLLSNDVKMIIAACGTVSSNFPKEEADKLPVPFMGILRPTAEAAISASRNRMIGVLGTEATISSGAFEREIHELSPDIAVVSKACPLFVPLVENGYASSRDPFVLHIAEEYLSDIRESGCDTVILGCTHYPHLSDVIQKILGEDVILINSGKETAAAAAKLVQEKDLGVSGNEDGHISFFVTENPDNFNEKASFFMGEEITQQIHKIDLI